MFRLRRDFLVEYQGGTWIIDAKWKLLDGADASINYGISQADFYQMFAYAHRYLRGNGTLLLVYPSCESFTEPMPHFDTSISAMEFASKRWRWLWIWTNYL